MHEEMRIGNRPRTPLPCTPIRFRVFSGDANRRDSWRHLDEYHLVRANHFRKGRCRMGRKYIDCRDYPGDVKCTVAISADTEEELLEAIVEHGKQVHGYEDTPEFRGMVRDGMKEGNPRG